MSIRSDLTRRLALLLTFNPDQFTRTGVVGGRSTGCGLTYIWLQRVEWDGKKENRFYWTGASENNSTFLDHQDLADLVTPREDKDHSLIGCCDSIYKGWRIVVLTITFSPIRFDVGHLRDCWNRFFVTVITGK